jgi:PIN domain nuclease of toxin-antitoxin system
LLDTHALLWLLAGSPRLESKASDLVTDAAHDVFASSVSLWEIAVKLRIGKIDANLERVIDGCRHTGLRFLEISHRHLLDVAALPVFDDHKDPFDHLLIAQAISEELVVVSDDRNFCRYKVSVVTCRNG